MFARILVPLDGSSLAEGILPEVAELARLHGAEVMLLRVALAHTCPGGEASEAQVHAVEEAEGHLAEVERRLVALGITVSRGVRCGDATEEILGHVRARHADLIAMSTHGRRGIVRLMLGSVAEAVLRASPVPVLLLRARVPVPSDARAAARGVVTAVRPRAAALSAPTFRHILCPVDFSPHSDRAMTYAGEMAQRFRADLTILHVVHDPLDVTCSHIPHPPLEQLREEMIREAEHALLRRVRRKLRFLPRAKTMVVAGPPFRQITRYAEEHQVDLIVIGTQGLSGLECLIMGSTAERVVRTAPCPVVSIRAAA
jgi:nucleotide-binding universal stress UspA family protein